MVTDGVVHLEPVAPGPVVVALGGVEDPAVAATGVEDVGLRRGNHGRQTDDDHEPGRHRRPQLRSPHVRSVDQQVLAMRLGMDLGVENTIKLPPRGGAPIKRWYVQLQRELVVVYIYRRAASDTVADLGRHRWRPRRDAYR